METGLALGSNVGDRLTLLSLAKKKILEIPDIKFVAQSPVYETEPIDVMPEFSGIPFLNCVLIVHSNVVPERLITLLQMVERGMGRKGHAARNAPRLIDLDIIYAGQLRIKNDHLEVPHPRWFKRRFVVQPLCDLRPDLRVSGQSCTVAEILNGLSGDDEVVFFTEFW